MICINNNSLQKSLTLISTKRIVTIQCGTLYNVSDENSVLILEKNRRSFLHLSTSS